MKKLALITTIMLAAAAMAQDAQLVDFTDSPLVLDANGSTLTWTAGGANGLKLDCYCKIAPQTVMSSYSVLQRCRLTFSTNGVLTHAELLPERVRIRAENDNGMVTRARASRLLRSHTMILEPLLPFAEAVEKTKTGDAQGWYALAIHYAKGEEVDLDLSKARQLMQKASDMNYSNAVFVVAMLLDADSATAKDCDGLGRTTPPINWYLGGTTHFRVWQNHPSLSVTNEVDVAKIRAGYERAISLGVSAATNELARFNRRVEAAQAQVMKDADDARQKAENAKLAEGLL